MTSSVSLLESIESHVVRGDAISSSSASTPSPIDPQLLAQTSSYGTVDWWKESYGGFGFSDEQYQVLEAVTWGVFSKRNPTIL